MNNSRLLAISTRMYALSEEDEFTNKYIWAQPANVNSVSFIDKDFSVLVLHGAIHRYDPEDEDEANVITNNLVDHFFGSLVECGLDLSAYEEIGFLFHPLTPDLKVRSEMAKQLVLHLKRRAPLLTVSFAKDYSTNEETGYGHILQLATTCRNEGGFTSYFENVWDYFAVDELLEAKLEFLNELLNFSRESELPLILSSYAKDWETFKRDQKHEGFSVALAVFRDALFRPI